MANDAPTANSTWQKWTDEFETASKAKGFEQWQKRAKKIIKRYRDDRGDGDGAGDGMATDGQYGSRFNILWSNVQTLMPALFAKTPKPVVERRYLDRDDVGRTASVILERALLYELDEGGYKSSVGKAVLDRLLPGRGVVWVRYEPKFAPMEAKTTTGKAGPTPARTEAPDAVTGDKEIGADQPDQTETGEEVASESTCVDYVDWKDFDTSPSRTWKEVWWIRRRVYMTREELVKRFPKCGKDVPLDWSPNKDMKQTGVAATSGTDNEAGRRAKILEVWDKTNRRVCWMAEGWGDEMLDEQDDPLRLENFWPTPEPLFATLTNDSLIPVPDYYEYQDQAVELDDLTNRITWLTKAIKIAGVYDASIEPLQRIFQEGKENELVPVDNMAEFISRAGSNGMGVIWLAPIAEMMKCLGELYIARDQVKQSLYEITGISDIVRGAAQAGGAKTATEQRIKGQFASMRLNDMQAEVARFARDTLRIMGEIISEHFDPMTLYLVSGFEQYAKEQWPPEPPAPSPMMGHNGGPPMQDGQQPMPQPAPGSMGAPMLPQITPEQAAQQKAAQMFMAAVKLLKSDKSRGFRIDIETDSLVEPDQQATQQARTELLGAISQFLPQAIEAGAAVPELKPLMARLLMFFLRGFKASRDIEAAFEQFIDDVTKDAANPQPKPPSSEQIKAQAEMAKMQMEQENAKLDAQLRTQELQEQSALEKAKLQQEGEIRMAELAQQERIEGAKLAQERELEMERIRVDGIKHQQTIEHEKSKHADEMNMKAHEVDTGAQQGEADREFKRDEKQLPKRDDLVKVVESHKKLVDESSSGLKEIKAGIADVTKRVDGLDKKIDAVAEDAGSPVEIMRGADGRATGVKRGKRTMAIKRGANGRAEAVQ